MLILEMLTNTVELFKQSGRFFHTGDELFGEYSWTQVMFGQGRMPKGFHSVAD
jgi:tryptophan halogenase